MQTAEESPSAQDLDPIPRRTVENGKPSCQGCRRRKLKCSREQPSCRSCDRIGLECIYENRRNKPGLKPGVVEALSRRVESLEKALLEREPSQLHESQTPPSNGHINGNGKNADGYFNILSTLCVELCKINNRHAGNHTASPCSSGPGPKVQSGTPLSTTSYQEDTRHNDDDSRSRQTRGHKRRRVDSCGNPDIELRVPLEALKDDGASALPPPQILEGVVNVYFNVIQPWIPLLHETQFRERIHDPEQVADLVVIMHAIVVAALRFSRPESHGLSDEQVDATTKRSRGIVVLAGMDSLSVENLQALVIIAFDDIGSGNASRAWSIIGSLTRTVEYLQLSHEQDYDDNQPVLKPLVSLSPPIKWVEEEERRRVFWNIFNLDRFCSVTTGWNTSLTVDDVHRRLPADGGLWHRQEKVTTPYFGIWDRSVAKLGRSIAFLPAQYPSPSQTSEAATIHDSPQPNRSSNQADMSEVGAFAYCIEATESLSRVTTFFLQQRIDFHDRREVSNWLTRFKELDLRLVHWKMFLPQKWKDSNISRQPAMVTMDPNLTLAHITHNTSMILLHQRIAYPPADWTRIVELPSSCSAETCLNAAMEIQNITEKYLKHTEANGPVTSQFAFCVFVAARILLVHWRYSGIEHSREMSLLVASLDEMARRWAGPTQSGMPPSRSLAGTYADHLRDLHQKCIADPSFSLDVLGYSTVSSTLNNRSLQKPAMAALSKEPNEDSQTGSAAPRLGRCNQTGGLAETQPGFDVHAETPVIVSQWNGNRSEPFQANTSTLTRGEGDCIDAYAAAEYSVGQQPAPDDLSKISYMLLDQGFVNMDRIISLDDMMFGSSIDPSSHGDMNVDLT